MKKKQYTNRKGINPVLLQMTEEQKAASAMRAANVAHKLLTNKVLHDVFGFGPPAGRNSGSSMRNSWICTGGDITRLMIYWIWQRKNGRSELI